APVVEAEKAPAEPAVAPLAGEASEETGTVLCDGAVRMRSLKRSPERGGRIGDGCSIGYRTQEGDPLEEAELGSERLPWALEVVAKRMQVGDVAEVVATGEHALADEETVADVEGLERALTAMVDGGGIGETTT
ncbi:Putative glycosyltransferase, partial [Durusdinium trenchii]